MKKLVKFFFKSYYPYIFIVASCMLLLHTFIQPGVPQTHDGNNHLARLANFYLVVKDRQFPPRWAPNLNYEFGYPVFNYNYYLPNIEAVVLFMIGFSLEESIKLLVINAFLGAGVALSMVTAALGLAHNENLSNGFNLYKIHEHKPRLVDLNKVATFNELAWKSNHHEYLVEASVDTTVGEKLAYFPGWATYVNDHPIQINTQHPDFPGVITYTLPKGKYAVKTVFTESTPARQWGDRISVLAGVGVLGYCFSKLARHSW